MASSKCKLNGKLTTEQVAELLDYNRETGVFRWKKRRGGSANAGTVAGIRKPRGHIEIKIFGQRYMAHRLAWLIVFGHWPAYEIDHIDLDPGNNRWGNLRLATASQNHANRRVQRDNICGLKGVSPCYGAVDKKTGKRKIRPGKWKAQISLNGRVHYLGQYNTPEEAHDAYRRAAPLYHGSYARAE